ncbi:hypothetical protein BLNAU_9857 [Blattamonas nauphoetae]|uniref:Uncharacterized protein n=1 Tax=Blattamonas nauphoetae TaxID=2049346 RepID=A0ABQ9XUH4_9EUKA|nr:hypothetical protein BLNAU_9857 [Blattamonas nauphoetae]
MIPMRGNVIESVSGAAQVYTGLTEPFGSRACKPVPRCSFSIAHFDQLVCLVLSHGLSVLHIIKDPSSHPPLACQPQLLHDCPCSPFQPVEHISHGKIGAERAHRVQ